MAADFARVYSAKRCKLAIRADGVGVYFNGGFSGGCNIALQLIFNLPENARTSSARFRTSIFELAITLGLAKMLHRFSASNKNLFSG